MSESTPIRKPPKRPQRPVERLDSLKNPQPRPPPQANKIPKRDCPNTDCNAKNSGEEEDGKTICRNCGTVIDELTMVSEVSYGLSTGGQHIVHGYHVGAGEAHAKRGDVIDRTRLYNSRELTRAHGHRYIIQIGLSLGMPGQLRDMGMHFFSLAIGGFIQGRRIKSVAAVALYIACRIQKNTNQFMLIDLADVLQINVFNLGHVYKCLLKHIRLNGNSYIIQPINPEDLILRFAQRLEFGKETMQVAKDAVRIVQRMNRDWMTPGRRPAGICGAALILAARMNNFRRTVREVVYVVKVQEQTIFNRLEEFKGTESSGLTVDEFRTIDLERYADPPAYAKEKAGKKKHGRKRKHVEFDDDGDNDQPTVISSRASSAMPPDSQTHLATPENTQQARLDSKKMPPPPPPIDPSLVEVSRQRLSGLENSPARAATESEAETGATNTSSIASSSESRRPTAKAAPEPPAKRRRALGPKGTGEPALDADITAALTDPTDIDHASALQFALESTSGQPSPPATQQPPTRTRPPIPDTEEILESEFADDPEVVNCLLTPEEVAIKTRIWTHENREHIRAQAAKLLKQQLAEANGTARVIVRRKRKRKRIGDMSDYIGEDGVEGTPVAANTAAAMKKMIQKRGFSKKINYDKFDALYTPSSSSASRRASESLHGGSPGEATGMLGRTESASPDGTTNVGDTGVGKKRAEGQIQSLDKGQDEQLKELESLAGELDEEIDESEDDGDDGDPYGIPGDEGMGYDSD